MALTGTVADRFDIDRLAGSGGMGAVYRAWDRHSGQLIALKVLHAHLVENAERFTSEARLLAELDHPGIVGFIAHGQTQRGEPFIAMEWLEGESLSERLRRENLTVGEALRVCQLVADALGVAHERGVVHRDLKPGNIFLVGTSLDRAKLLDFGIARLPGHDLTATNAMLGTPGYMAPEQVKTARDITPAADVYALGAVLFRCLTGRRVFDDDNALSMALRVIMEPAPRLSTFRADVPARLDELVAAMLGKEPASRPPTGAAVAAALRQVEHGRMDTAPKSTRIPMMASGRCFVLARRPPGSVPLNTTQVEQLSNLVLAHHGHLEMLGDGTVVVTVSAEESIDVVVAAGARCALALRAVDSSFAMALMAEPATLVVSPDRIQQGVALIERSRSGQIRVGPTAAGLLGPPFDLRRTPEGCRLEGISTGPAAGGKPESATGHPMTGQASSASVGTGEPASAISGQGGAAAAMDASTATGAATRTVRTRRNRKLWVIVAASFVVLAGLVTGGFFLLRDGQPVDDGPDPNRFACPMDACVRYDVDDWTRVDVVAALPEATKLAHKLLPESQLVMISVAAPKRGQADVRGGKGGAFLYRMKHSDGRVEHVNVILSFKRFMARRLSSLGQQKPVVTPDCSGDQAWQAVTKAGRTSSGQPRTMVYRFVLKEELSAPGTSAWEFVFDDGSVFVDGKRCRVLSP